MNKIINNNLKPGSLYKINYCSYWPVCDLTNPDASNPYKEVCLTENDILLFIKVITIPITKYDTFNYGYLFLCKNLTVVIAYDYFRIIINNDFEQL